MNDDARVAQLIHGICALQEEKERAYGVDWKRFGLVSSMFNVFRKFIRLRTMWQGGWKPSTDDTRLDTIIDLLNYLILCLLLHAHIMPERFSEFFSDKDPGARAADMPTNESGFKVFCRRVLLPDAENAVRPVPDLTALIPEIIRIGEPTIEEWLLRLAQVAQGERQKLETNQEPSVRIAGIYKMIRLSVMAAIRHGEEHPEEWNNFMRRYGPK